MRLACKSGEAITLQMKSPPNISVGFTCQYLFDSVFKECSDPNNPRSDGAKLCDLSSGGVSAIATASFLLILLPSASERYGLLHSAILRRSIFHTANLQTGFTSYL